MVALLEEVLPLASIITEVVAVEALEALEKTADQALVDMEA
jgi:hypothetical protein